MSIVCDIKALRDHPRYSGLPLSVKLKNKNNGFLTSELRNISLGGFLIRTPEIFHVYEKYDVNINLFAPDAVKFDIDVKEFELLKLEKTCLYLEAMVWRISADDEIKDYTSCKVAFRFIKMDDAVRDIIGRFLDLYKNNEI